MISKGNKCLVTGADGFIGSHLTELLLQKGYKVKALSFYNSFNYWGWLEDIPANENLEIVSGDIRDPHFMKQIMNDVDLVFHLAALIAIPFSYQAPGSYVETNIKGTLNICQAAKELGGIRVIHTSTAEVYGTALYVPMDEKHPKQPQSPYSASKMGADAMAMSFYNAFNLPVVVARPINTYGPRQSARAIIPTIISQIAVGMKKIKLGDLTTFREFNFIKDICQGFLAVAECDKTIGKEVNICSNYETSIQETLNMIQEIMQSDIQIMVDDQRLRPERSEVLRLWGENKLIRELTGFKPQFTLRKGLEITCEWFSKPENLKKYKAEIYNI